MTLLQYLPTPDSLTEAELTEARQAMTTWLADYAPTLDTRPGSVFDGFFFKHAVHMTAALNRAIDGFQADLDMAGVAAGRVTDCDMLVRLLAGFGAKPADNTQQTGYLLLTFNTNRQVTIPGGTRFVFGAEDVFIPTGGTVTLAPAGTGVINRLVRLSDTSYAFALQVTGYASKAIEAGVSASWNNSIEGLRSAVTQNAFVQGAVALTVPQLAKMAMQTVHHSGFASRLGVVRHIQQELPDVSGVVVTATGDREQLRAALTLSGLSGGGCVDVRVASKYKATVSQTVFLPYYDAQEGTAVDKFIGVFDYLHVPQRIVAVAPLNEDQVVLQPTWLSLSKDPARAPLLTCAFSRLEELRLVVPMPRSDAGAALVGIGYSETEQAAGAWFTVTYEAEPAVDSVSALLDREGAVGFDVLVKAPLPAVISHLQFNYSAPVGVLLNAEQALADLSSYVDSLFGAGALSAEVLNDHVFAAGAESVKRTIMQGSVLLSNADYVLDAAELMPEVDYAAALAAAVRVPKLSINSAQDVSNLAYTDPALGTADQHMATASSKIVRVMTVRTPVYQHEL